MTRGVSIFYNWDNYWHFINDVLGQFYVLEKTGFDFTIPVVIPRRVLKYNYVQAFLNSQFAKKLNIIFQDEKTMVKILKPFFCKHISNTKPLFSFVISTLSTTIENNLPEIKIFVDRSKSRGRHIINREDVLNFLQRNGYLLVDADELDYNDQIRLFSSASEIIGLHGAGLSNIIFRYPKKTKVIEIFSEDYIGAHYYWLSKEMDFAYKAFLSGPLIDNGIYIDIEKLKRNILF